MSKLRVVGDPVEVGGYVVPLSAYLCAPGVPKADPLRPASVVEAACSPPERRPYASLSTDAPSAFAASARSRAVCMSLRIWSRCC